MFNAWDEGNILPNLETLANLKEGDHFKINFLGRITIGQHKDPLAKIINLQGQDDSISKLIKAAIDLSK